MTEPELRADLAALSPSLRTRLAAAGFDEERLLSQSKAEDGSLFEPVVQPEQKQKHARFPKLLVFVLVASSLWYSICQVTRFTKENHLRA